MVTVICELVERAGPLPPERSVVIDVAAIRHNVARLKALAAPAQFMAVVKADAYGHGAVPVAQAALQAGADVLGVAHVAEAMELRQAGIAAPIVAWLHTHSTDFVAAIEHGVELGVSGWELETIIRLAQEHERVALVHLKVDTGLGRNGYTMQTWPAAVSAAARAQAQGWINVVGIMAHLGAADDLQASETSQQLELFHQAVRIAHEAGLRPQKVHTANTPGLFAAHTMPDPSSMLCDMVRVGIGIYGISPFADRNAQQLGLIPAMTLRTTVCNLKEVPAGQGVSYGFTYKTQQPTTLALIPLGYADGVPRIGTGGPVRIKGRTYAEVGRVAMDQIVVDLGQPDLAAGDPHQLLGAEAVLFGADDNPSVREWAQAAQTIDYEIVTRISPRVTREYVDTGRDTAQGEDSEQWSLTVPVTSAESTQHVACQLAEHLRPGDVVVLTGELGAGKTTFTQGLGRGLGIGEAIISPTFVLARQHPNDPHGSNPGGPMLVHVDAYRLSSAAEIDDIDLEHTLDSAVTVVEWGRGKVEHLTDSRLEIIIDRDTGTGSEHNVADIAQVIADMSADPDAGQQQPRQITIRGFGPRWAEEKPDEIIPPHTLV